MKRLILLVLGVSVLLGAVLYSKWRPESLRVSGFIEADEIRLGSRLGGRVSVVHVSEGQQVQEGALLVELEPYDLVERKKELELTLAVREADFQRIKNGFREEEKAQAKAKVDQLQANLDLLRAGPRKQEIEAAMGRKDLAVAELKLADESYKRASQLARENATSQQELDKAREGWEVASANLVVSQQELDLLKAGTREEQIREATAQVEQAHQAWQLMVNGNRREDIEQAKASRDAAQASLAAIETQMKELSIKSPIEGSVEALDLQPGDMVAPSAPVLSMLDNKSLWVRAYVPQNRVGIKVGQQVRMSIDSFPDEDFEGTISFVARQAEFTPSNVQTPEERSKQVFRIKVTIQDERDRLRPGMMADVWLDSIGIPE